METFFVLVHLVLSEGFEYSTVSAQEIYKDGKSNEKALDKIELDFRRKDKAEVKRFTTHNLRINSEDKNMDLYRCLFSHHIK